MNDTCQLIDQMRRRQAELQIAVSRQQEELAALMTELNAVKRAVRSYEDVMNPPRKPAKRPLMITGPVGTAPVEPVPAIKPRRGRAMPTAKSIGVKGGHARAAKLTTEQRQEFGRRGAAARWAKQREREAAQATP